MIKTEVESHELFEEFGFYERCVFCGSSCCTWSAKCNNPVCTECSEKHNQSDLDKLIKEGGE